MTSYRQITFEILRDELKISPAQVAFLPVALAAQPLPAWLSAYLAVVNISAVLAKTEKSLSESLVASVLHAVRERNASRISLFPASRCTATTPGASAILSLPVAPILFYLTCPRL